MRNYLVEDVEVFSLDAESGEWGAKPEPVLKCTLKGCLDNEGGREVYDKGKIIAVSTHTLYTIQPGIAVADLVKVDGVEYQVLYVSDFGKHIEIGLEMKR